MTVEPTSGSGSGGSVMGKASTSKRLRRESGWKRPRAVAPPDPAPVAPVRLSVCSACGARGLVDTVKGTCTGLTNPTPAALLRGAAVQSRAKLCKARVKRRRT